MIAPTLSSFPASSSRTTKNFYFFPEVASLEGFGGNSVGCASFRSPTGERSASTRRRRRELYINSLSFSPPPPPTDLIESPSALRPS